MLTRDLIRLTFGALRFHRLRSGLAALGIAVGIAAVILLTSIGQGLQEFVLSEFSQFGTNLLIVQPGKVTTAGSSIGSIASVRPVTIEDAEAVARLPYVQLTNPAIDGNAEITFGHRHRRVSLYGMGPNWPAIGKMSVSMGTFLPREETNTARPLAVLGATAKEELFGDVNPLGQHIEIGGSRFRVIGVMASKGQFVGMDLDDTVFIPVVRAQELFNRADLAGFHVTFDPGAPVDTMVDNVRKLMIARHGRDDVTIITQQKMVEVLGSVMGVLTFAVGALGSISLLVGGVGILTIMTIAISERTAEIGVLRALGARQEQIQLIFLAEAALLAATGGAAGLALGVGIARSLAFVFPALPVSTPWWFAVLAEMVAVTVGLIAGVLPARYAAQLEPVEALRAE